jgi:hypothetical protein
MSSVQEEDSESSEIRDVFRAVKLKAKLKEVKSQLFHNKEILCLEMYEDVPYDKLHSKHLDQPDQHHEEDMSVESQRESKRDDSNKNPNTSKLSGETT